MKCEVYLIIYLPTEEDKYESCAGDAMRKCIIREEILTREGISRDSLAAVTDYISCFEDAAIRCDAPILSHFIFTLKGYRKHLEERHGKYRKKSGNIPVPSQGVTIMSYRKSVQC